MGIKRTKPAAKPLGIAAEIPIPTQRRSPVIVIAIAKKEGRDILIDTQYVYVMNVIKRLVAFHDPAHMADMPIRRVDDFHELRLKGSSLGKKNLRVFFGYFDDTNEIVVVKVWQKDNEDQTPKYVVVNVQTRLRKYREGELRANMTIFPKKSLART